MKKQGLHRKGSEPNKYYVGKEVKKQRLHKKGRENENYSRREKKNMD